MTESGRDDGQQFDELRELLFGPQKDAVERIEKVEERIDNPRLRAEDVSEVLSQAVVMRNKRDQTLSHALEEPVATAIEKSVKKDPTPIVDAIFPVIGPAIRKSIAHTLRGMIQQFNQALEHSLSPRSLMWRLEARRTGRSFAEVVLLKTLVYKVEQVFLIHRENGLLLQHVTAADVLARDADLVSAMLTAIQDFVKDSFQAREDEAVQTMQVGEHSIWVEQGSHAVLALVIRGDPPESVRTDMQTALERIEADMSADLESFDGDTTAFETCEPYLESCLGEAKKQKRAGELVPFLVFALLLCGLLYLGYLYAESKVNEARWEDYLHDLDAEPGIVVTHWGERDGKFFVAGLRDPLARDPRALLVKLEQDEVDDTWQPYEALEPVFIMMRATRKLRPPKTVQITLDGDTLVIAGEAPRAWIRRAEALAPTLSGVALARTDELVDLDAKRYGALKAAIEAGRDIRPETFSALAGHAKAIGKRIRVEVRGSGAKAAVTRMGRAGVPLEFAAVTGNGGGETLSFRVVEE